MNGFGGTPKPELRRFAPTHKRNRAQPPGLRPSAFPAAFLPLAVRHSPRFASPPVFGPAPGLFFARGFAAALVVVAPSPVYCAVVRFAAFSPAPLPSPPPPLGAPGRREARLGVGAAFRSPPQRMTRDAVGPVCGPSAPVHNPKIVNRYFARVDERTNLR